MKFLLGLGNPGRRYDGTAHNLGFDVADELARRWKLTLRYNAQAKADLAEGQIAGVPALLAKPQTFMNLSGDTAAAITRQRDAGPDDLLVIVDDVAISIGQVRIRPDGSSGSHNGLRSIIERLGHSEFARLRVGIRPLGEIESLKEYVLRKLPPLEREQLRDMTGVAADAAECWLREGSRSAADKFNGLRLFTQG